MQLLNNNFFIAGIISLLFFSIKYIINNKGKDKDNSKKKMIFKDSMIVLIIAFAILTFKDNYYTKTNEKTTIFTNEPNF